MVTKVRLTDEQVANRAEWVAALRSGEYVQTKGKMHRIKAASDAPIGYCCMGVACHIQGLVEHVDYEPGNVGYEFPNGQTFSGYPDVEWFAEKYGFTMSDASDFAELNDSKGEDFDFIADIIEWDTAERMMSNG